MYLLGIDIGTTNCKAAIFDKNAQLLAISSRKTTTHFDKNKWATYNPEEMWDSVVNVVKELCCKVDKPEKIAAISVSSMAEAGVTLDKNGYPTFPIIAWFDRRSISQSRFLERKIGKERIFEITGHDNNPIFSLPKILWIKDNAPDAFKKTVKWLCISDYIYYKLTNNFGTDYTIASRTLLLDIHLKQWSKELLDLAGLSIDLLPPIYKSGTIIGKVTKEAAYQTGLKEGIPVVIGGQDHPCGLLGSGTLLDHKILDSSGTAEAFIAPIPEENIRIPKKFIGLRYSRFLDPDYLLPWGGIISSGLSIDWVIDKLFDSKDLDYKEIIGELKNDTTPGSNGLIYLPHLRGSGAPSWDPKSRGAFIGLRDIHTRKDMLRSVIEGLCFEAKTILDLMKNNSNYQFSALNTIGGGARIFFWQQVKADITGIKVVIPEVEQAVVKGACLLAGIGIGLYKDMLDASKRMYSIKKEFLPNDENRKTYEKLYKTYRTVYRKIKSINRQLYKQFY